MFFSTLLGHLPTTGLSRRGYNTPEMNTERLRELLAPILPYISSPWVVGVPVLFLAVYVFLGYSYLNQLSEQDRLKAERDKQADIAARSAAPQLLAKKEAEWKAIQEAVPSADLTEIAVFRTMWDLAAQAGLNPRAVLPTLTGTSQQQIGGTPFRVMTFSITASGAFGPVWEFIRMLNFGLTPYNTLVLGNTRFTLGSSSNATMDFKIYTRVAGN